MRRALIIAASVVVFAATIAVGGWLFQQHRITHFVATGYGSPDPKVVEIPPGSTVKVIAQLLAGAQVVSDAELLVSYLHRDKLGPRLKAGEYEFTGALTPEQVIARLISGKVKQYHFTVAEGLRVDEILPVLAASELKLDPARLRELAQTPAFVRKLGVPADGLEGFLFPDTYSFPRGATEEAVLAKMVNRTLDEFKAARPGPGVEFDLLQGITMASIVEKETGANEPEARAHISCVFHNRLRMKMRLDTDPTVLYAKFLTTGSFSRNITRADLHAPHPYNTYTVKGLPPGPIASPGRAAIRAAMQPLDCKDLYFVSRNDGTSVFCPDLKCHSANVDRFQRHAASGEPEGGTEPQGDE